MNPFRFGSSKVTEKDLQSTVFFASRPPALVTEEQALSIPAVKSSVELISNSIAQLPVYLYSENEEDGSVEKLTDDRIDVLNQEANDFENSYSLKKKVVQDYLLRGRSYIYKDHLGKLHHIPAKNVAEELYTEDSLTISKREYKVQGLTSDVLLSNDEVILIDSGTNGLLADNYQLFQTAISQLEYQHSIMNNGAVPTGILKAATRLTEGTINRLRTSFDSLYKGTKNAGKTVLLEEGLDFTPISMNPNEVQLIEANKQIVSEIARIFNLPESMINSAANKYASNEQNSIQFLQGTLSPIITAIENAFDKTLLHRAEKDLGFYFRFETSEILRTTESEKIKAVSDGLKAGIYSFNESRAKLDLPKTDKDYFVLSIGNVLRYETGDLENLNLGPQQNQPGGTNSDE